jgi:hypothetical protein
VTRKEEQRITDKKVRKKEKSDVFREIPNYEEHADHDVCSMDSLRTSETIGNHFVPQRQVSG